MRTRLYRGLRPAGRQLASPKSTVRMLGRFWEYTISNRSSRVLEQTMLESAVVTTTPPELQGWEV